jgi:hypothetical protein
MQISTSPAILVTEESGMGEFNEFKSRVGLLLAIDHGSRAGNAFVLTLFDQHPEVLCIPWMMYCYSYIVHAFGVQTKLPSQKAHELVTTTGYFRYLYNDITPEVASQICRWGGDPDAKVNRDILRQNFDQLILASNEIDRKDLVMAMLYSYAKAVGRTLQPVKYIMLADAISMRYENPVIGYSGVVIDEAEKDFEDFTLISLNRDPRAQFASCRHQYINQNGNAYGVTPWNFLKRIYELIFLKLYPENFAFLFWSFYQIETYKTIKRHLKKRGRKTIRFINEDINLDFIPTMTRYCETLGIGLAEEWKNESYIPTSVGSQWRGTGAYNNRYQQNRDGSLKNDSDEISAKSIGPNSIVTERWKKRLPDNEKYLLTHMFREEIEDLYPDSHFSFYLKSKFRMVSFFWASLGEFPNLIWIFEDRTLKGGLNRLFYFLSLPFWYLMARISLIRLVDKKGMTFEG